MRRVSENRILAKDLFAFVEGDSAYRKKNKITLSAQARIKSFLREAIHLAWVISVRASGLNDFNAQHPRFLREIRELVTALNGRIKEYPSVERMVFVDEKPHVLFATEIQIPPGKSELECIMGRAIITLLDNAGILDIKRCCRSGCKRLHFSNRDVDKFCSPACRHADWNQQAHRKEIRSAEARSKYHTEQARDAKHRGDRTKAKMHATKAKEAERAVSELKDAPAVQISRWKWAMPLSGPDAPL